MIRKRPLDRARALAADIAEQSAITRTLIARCLEILRAPRPDTFLGRKTQEPFPRQKATLCAVSEAERMAPAFGAVIVTPERRDPTASAVAIAVNKAPAPREVITAPQGGGPLAQVSPANNTE